jgi:SAM-dependent methyltransferase
MGLVSKGIQILREEGLVSLGKKGSRFAVRQTYKIGSERECPVCGFTGRKFKAAGTPPREEARCPNCGAAERHRLLTHYIESETDLIEGNQQILYFAPVDRIARNIQQYGNSVIATDLSMPDVDIHADITRLPFSNETFDTVICSHVLEHIPNDSAAMSELYRILADEGCALIIVPKDKGREHTYEDGSITSPGEREREFGQSDHVRWYGRDFPQRLSEAGFEVITETYAETLQSKEVDKFGLKVDKTNETPDGRTMKYSGDVVYEDIHRCMK